MAQNHFSTLKLFFKKLLPHHIIISSFPAFTSCYFPLLSLQHCLKPLFEHNQNVQSPNRPSLFSLPATFQKVQISHHIQALKPVQLHFPQQLSVVTATFTPLCRTQLCVFIRLSASQTPRKHPMMAQIIVFLTASGQMQIKFLVPGLEHIGKCTNMGTFIFFPLNK